MKQSDTEVALGILVAAYPRMGITEATVSVYREALKDIPPSELSETVKTHISKSKWFPTIAELRCAVAEKNCGAPTKSEALGQIVNAIAMRTAKDAHPLVREALEMSGGLWEARTTIHPAIWRTKFLDAYEEIRTRKLDEIVVDGYELLPGKEAPMLGE